MEELTLEFKLQNATEEQQKEMEKLQATIEADADFAAANSLEEAYAAVKKYVNLTPEQFKAAYENVQEAITEFREKTLPKQELSDGDLDVVAGGGFIMTNNDWKKAAMGAVLSCSNQNNGGVQQINNPGLVICGGSVVDNAFTSIVMKAPNLGI